MPTLCAAVGCLNISQRGSPFHFNRFSSDPRISKQWVSAMKRDKYVPSKRSVLCSAHFPEDMYENKVRIMKKLGLAVTPRLIQGAVPTIFSHKRQPPQHTRGSFTKRRRIQDLQQAPSFVAVNNLAEPALEALSCTEPLTEDKEAYECMDYSIPRDYHVDSEHHLESPT
ncbi:hypothetical protein HPB47_002746 [Ixodes persulcatus]|uniref:Uncharacterized protein n=1 Tax=Ixodes persulcatus TaxID=34615 RepID=A0AC60PKC2_IXOPE|nr:hypothetical protein HPB47_002746 [Ixodes persulcatus]